MPGQWDLSQAVIDGDTSLVAALLAAGADPNLAHEDGEVPLHKAACLTPDPDSPNARSDAAQIVSLLLAHGAEVGRRDTFGRTPLDVAYLCANVVAVQVLRDAGAVLVDLIEGATVEERSTADLSLTVLEGDADRVQALLRGGVNVNLRDRYGRTALHAAAGSGDTALADLLLTHGADPAARADGDDVNGMVYPRQGEMPLHLAARGGHEAMVRLLLSRGANVEADSGLEAYYSPLQQAVFSGAFRQEGRDKQSHRTIQVLLDHGADPLACSPEQTNQLSALCIAAWIGAPETVALLLEHVGERLTFTDLQKAMHAAIIDNGHENLAILWQAGQRLSVPLTLFEVLPHITGAGLRVLLEKVPDIDIQARLPETGETLLLWVVRHVQEPTEAVPWLDIAYHEEDVIMLLQRGADATSATLEGESALSVAQQRGREWSAA